MTPKQLRAARKRLGMTQGKLAEALDYAGKQTIWLKENGRRPITERDALAIEALERRMENGG